MKDKEAEANSPSQQQGTERSEPVRSRWTPKPEQILILESIFNSGMVNPPKDETVRIRQMLEKYGSVGDANVFYWFQNRRSRSRRRQRQIQAAGLITDQRIPIHQSGGVIQYEPTSSVACFASSSPSSFGGGSSSASAGAADDLFAISRQMGLPEIDQNMCPSDTSNLQYDQSPGLLTVFINGVPTEVPRGPFDVKAMFGQDVILVHSTGLPVPVNEYGISLQSLQLGESYFLVSRST